MTGPRAAAPRPSARCPTGVAEDEAAACEVVSELLARMGITAEVIAVDNPSTVPLDEEDPPPSSSTSLGAISAT